MKAGDLVRHIDGPTMVGLALDVPPPIDGIRPSVIVFWTSRALNVMPYRNLHRYINLIVLQDAFE